LRHVRYALPQPYEEFEHTADLGLAVEGTSADEALARLVLALAATMAGGGEVAAARELVLHVEPNSWTRMAVDVLREQLHHFAVKHEIVQEVEVVEFDPRRGATLNCRVGPYDAARHEEGPELKAVTLHEACLESRGSGWVARVIVDV
jgi:SHS2 domain-containing protein